MDQGNHGITLVSVYSVRNPHRIKGTLAMFCQFYHYYCNEMQCVYSKSLELVPLWIQKHFIKGSFRRPQPPRYPWIQSDMARYTPIPLHSSIVLRFTRLHMESPDLLCTGLPAIRDTVLEETTVLSLFYPIIHCFTKNSQY